MRICFLSRLNPNNYKSWSGTSYHMFKTLSSCHDVTWVGYRNLNLMLRVLIKVETVLDKILNIRRGYPYFNKRLAKLKGQGLNRKIRAGEFDIIVSPNSPDLVAYLQTSVPIIYIRDCTFQLFINYYPTFSNLTRKAIDDGNGLEQRAIDNASRVVYSSVWAARSAIDFYGANPAKVSIINFGANLTEGPPFLADKPSQGVCNILFIGVDWQRKGGEIALRTFQKLKADGIRCRLIVAGCDIKLKRRADVEIVPFLDKTKTVQLHRLTEMYSNAHFVILPTIADCTPIVFSEAAAFGVPVLTTDTGGNSSVITDGVNGYLFSPGATEIDYANKIKAVFTNKTVYNELRSTCRKEFDTRLSWNVWMHQINNLIEEAKNSVFNTADLISINEGKEKVLRD
jgi:glycosyltransferase involved in cell wall biosynthesis